MKTKDKLTRLFDYQKFEKNSHLDEVINSALNNEVFELNDDMLMAAAGGAARPLCHVDDIVTIKHGTYAGETAKILEVKQNCYYVLIKHVEKGELIQTDIAFTDVDD